jgi:murein DD-endopeptidase MepM/ murein hydrolase activator NlpD
MVTRLGRCALTLLICCTALQSGSAPLFVAHADSPSPASSAPPAESSTDTIDAVARRGSYRLTGTQHAPTGLSPVVLRLEGIVGLQTSAPRAIRIWQRSIAAAAQHPLLLPAGGLVTRGFHARIGHYGLDIELGMNSPVLAAADGVVLRAGWDKLGYGKMVWIEHADGLRTLYAHLNAPLVSAGDVISRGQLIGLSGNSGYSLGPHLHFEVSHNGEKLNPLAFFPDGVAGSR